MKELQQTELLDAEGLRATDQWAMEELSIPGTALMRTAGERLADVVLQLQPESTALIFCGPGNNGGDGYVLASELLTRGLPVRVASIAPPGRIVGDAAWAQDRYLSTAGAPTLIDVHADGEAAFISIFDGVSVIVDCLLGTGTIGAPRGLIATAIAEINAHSAEHQVPVVACDIPSGVDSDSGRVISQAVSAATTVTFHRASPGHWVSPGKHHVGKLVVTDIGIPDRAPDPESATPKLLDQAVVRQLRSRAETDNKFSSGHVVVLGGSPGMTGAAAMCTTSALAAGAGYATLAAHPAVLRSTESSRPSEALTLQLDVSQGTGALNPGAAAEQLLQTLRFRPGTLVVGPGLGQHPSVRPLLDMLLAGSTGTLVIDADAINAYADQMFELSEALANHQAVLTPHSGELGRLLGLPTSEINASRLHHARETAVQTRAVVVLKGDDTLIAAPDGRVVISPGGVPGLATAGTGDVLAGLLGALIARGAEPFLAAQAAVAIHLRAGKIVQKQLGVDGVSALKVAENIGPAREQLAGI